MPFIHAGHQSVPPSLLIDGSARVLEAYRATFRVRDIMRPCTVSSNRMPSSSSVARGPGQPLPDERRPIRVTHVYNAAPTTVFDAWIRPITVRRWLFASPTSKIIRAKVDVRVGGEFSILERRADGEVEYFGLYVEIDRPHRLAFTLEAPSHFSGLAYVMVQITGISTGSTLVLTQEGAAHEDTGPSWRTMLSRLAEVLGEV